MPPRRSCVEVSREPSSRHHPSRGPAPILRSADGATGERSRGAARRPHARRWARISRSEFRRPCPGQPRSPAGPSTGSTSSKTSSRSTATTRKSAASTRRPTLARRGRAGRVRPVDSGCGDRPADVRRLRRGGRRPLAGLGVYPGTEARAVAVRAGRRDRPNRAWITSRSTRRPGRSVSTVLGSS